jgi:N-acetylmuramoyl-L-alanine amidase
MKYKELLLPSDCKARPGIPLDRLDAITIHWIGPYPKQFVSTPRQWWIDCKGEAAAHYIIKDEDCINTIPPTELAYHCGNYVGNHTSIGIEVIPANEDGEFSMLSIQTLKELLQQWPNLPIRRHFDWSGKDCPRYYTPLSLDGTARWCKLLTELERI